MIILAVPGRPARKQAGRHPVTVTGGETAGWGRAGGGA
jgi:hypothetical protein